MEQTKTAVEELTFTNVALYVSGGLGSIQRTDCKMVMVKTNQQWAQYTDSIRIEYLQKGKRKSVARMLSGIERWVRVVNLEHAISPDAMFHAATPGSSPGVTVREGRYSSCDPRWKTDFEDKLAAAAAPVLFAAGEGQREGEFLERMKAIHDKQAAPKLSWTEVEV